MKEVLRSVVDQLKIYWSQCSVRGVTVTVEVENGRRFSQSVTCENGRFYYGNLYSYYEDETGDGDKDASSQDGTMHSFGPTEHSKKQPDKPEKQDDKPFDEHTDNSDGFTKGGGVLPAIRVVRKAVKELSTTGICGKLRLDIDGSCTSGGRDVVYSFLVMPSETGDGKKDASSQTGQQAKDNPELPLQTGDIACLKGDASKIKMVIGHIEREGAYGNFAYATAYYVTSGGEVKWLSIPINCFVRL
jgi:hypothetical protein